MKDVTIKILLIEDNESYAALIVKSLIQQKRVSFDIEYADTLSKAMEKLKKETIDLILLDLVLPDSQGLESFQKINVEYSDIPVVVLTAVADEEIAVMTVQLGAQDYLIKGHVETDILVRSIRYAIERNKTKMTLQSLSLLDDLTQLYNRRGFMALAEQITKLSIRKKRKALIFFADVDKLKNINDSFNHQKGDEALIDTANILRKTFRETDIIARMGGDEFAAIACEFSGHTPDIITQRLNKTLIQHNEESGREYRLSISFGFAEFDPSSPPSIDELLTQADKQMYEMKKKKNL